MSIYLITGENTTLANDYLNQTINTLGEIEIKRLNEKISLSEFQTALQTTDMFSQHSVYILKNPNWIAKINKSNKAQFEECFTIAKNFNIPIIIQVKKIICIIVYRY